MDQDASGDKFSWSWRDFRQDRRGEPSCRANSKRTPLQSSNATGFGRRFQARHSMCLTTVNMVSNSIPEYEAITEQPTNVLSILSLATVPLPYTWLGDTKLRIVQVRLYLVAFGGNLLDADLYMDGRTRLPMVWMGISEVVRMAEE